MSSALTRISSVDDLARVGEVFVKSGFFADTRDAAQAIVKVMAGQELGFAPIASMTGVYIVKGKVSLSANLIAAAVKRSGRYTFRVRKHDATVCEIEFFECDKLGNKESIGFSSFSIEEARAAKLTDSATWKNFPRNMLYARAISNGAKWHCPDVFGGPVYTPDELGATIDGETGEMIDVSPAAAISAPAPAQVWVPAIRPPAPAPVAMATEEQVESLKGILNGLLEYGIEDDKIRAAVLNIAKVELPQNDRNPLAVLTGEQAETLITRLGSRLQQLDEEAAAAKATPAPLSDDAGPEF
jgi:hypothetical protein